MKPGLFSILFVASFMFTNTCESGIGYAVLVGVVKAGDSNYDDRATAGSAKDVDAMFTLLRARGFDEKNIIRLTTTEQTRPQVILRTLQQQIKKTSVNDLFVFYFSGHGTQKPELPGHPSDESDSLDEYLVAYQGDICDDDLADVWQSAKSGAHLVVILDACHSGKTPMLTRAHATPEHPFVVPVAEYVTLAETDYSQKRTIRNSRTGSRRNSSTSTARTKSIRSGSCLSETIDSRPTYQLIYMGAVLDEESAIAFPDGRGKFTQKLIRLTTRFPGASYRDFAHRLLPAEGTCSNEAAYAELGVVPAEFANSIFLKP